MGVLRARVGTQWIDVLGGVGPQGPAGAPGAQGPKGDPGAPGVQGPIGPDEVIISPDQPTDPVVDFWYDTDGVGQPYGVPLGGAAGAILTKRSATDLDTQWTPRESQTRILKSATEAGFTNAEFAVSGFNGFNSGAIAAEFTRIQYGLSCTIQTAGGTGITVRLRQGAGIAGAVVESQIFPYPLTAGFSMFLGGMFLPSGFADQQLLTLSVQGSGAVSFSVLAGSWIWATSGGR